MMNRRSPLFFLITIFAITLLCTNFVASSVIDSFDDYTKIQDYSQINVASSYVGLDNYFTTRQALSFDGNDYVEVPNTMGTLSYITISVWAKSNVAGSGYATHAMVVDRKMTVASTYALYLDSASNKISLQVRLNGSEATSRNIGAKTALDTQWHHYVATYDGSTLKLYVDAVLQTSPLSISGIIDSDNPGVFRVGARSDNQFYWNGIVDSPRVYNWPFTQGNVTATYNGGNIDDGLVAYYPFNGDVLDYSGNVNHGTNFGATYVDGYVEDEKEGLLYSSGWFTSINLLQALNVSGVTDFTYDLVLEEDSSASIQFTQDCVTWHNSTSLANGSSEILADGVHAIDLSHLGYVSSFFHYNITFEKGTNNTSPQLHDLNIAYTNLYYGEIQDMSGIMGLPLNLLFYAFMSALSLVFAFRPSWVGKLLAGLVFAFLGAWMLGGASLLDMYLYTVDAVGAVSSSVQPLAMPFHELFAYLNVAVGFTCFASLLIEYRNLKVET